MKRLPIAGAVVSILAAGSLAIAAGGAPAEARQPAAAERVRDWIAGLSSPEANARASAACSLGELGERADAAISALGELLADEAIADRLTCEGQRHTGPTDDSQTTVGEVAAVALARINGPAVDRLLGALTDSRALVRSNGAVGLGLAGSNRAVMPLVRVLTDEEPKVRAKAAWALGLQGDDRAVAPLAGAVGDTSPSVREQAAWALGLKGNERSVDALVNALADRVPEVRSRAAWALGLRGDARAVLPLVEALRDNNTETASQAAWALGLKGDARALDGLQQALQSPAADLRKQAAWALGMITMRNGGPSPDIRPDPRPNVSTRSRSGR